MKSILQDIWYGRTERFDKIGYNRELLQAVHDIENIQKILTEKFSKEQNELFNQYEKQMQDISCLAEEEAFIKGIRYGASFILAVFDEK